MTIGKHDYDHPEPIEHIYAMRREVLRRAEEIRRLVAPGFLMTSSILTEAETSVLGWSPTLRLNAKRRAAQ
jgi:hypothetical protein